MPFLCVNHVKNRHLSFPPIPFFFLFFFFKRTDRGASTFYFKNLCPRLRPRSIWFVPTITLESLNQSEPNFHTWLLSRQPQPSSKMGIAGHM